MKFLAARIIWVINAQRPHAKVVYIISHDFNHLLAVETYCLPSVYSNVELFVYMRVTEM